jgi:hypothetical protein
MGETRRTLIEVLEETADILIEERRALRDLDAEAIDGTAHRKLKLCAELGTMMPVHSMSANERKALEQVRTAAQQNQLLLVHARGCVGRALALATGQPFEGYAEQRTAPSAPTAVRVNLTG